MTADLVPTIPFDPAAGLSLDELPAAIDMTRRDQWGRYMILDPLGNCSGYTRVTTVAGTLDSGGGLAPWKSTMTAVGLMLRKGLRAQWEALVAEFDGDPWYHSEASKAACKKLVEECAKVGGATDRAEVGTSLHTLTALVDTGKLTTADHLSDETQRDLAAYVEGLAKAGVVIDPQLVELTIVLDEYRVAGTFDRIVTVPGFDKPLIADLKTGADLSYSWHSIAVQLAAYAHADSIYVQGAKADGSQDVRLPMPEVDQRHGLIMWLNAGTGQLELHIVDIEAGWEAFKLSLAARSWRGTKGERIATLIDDYQPTLDLTTALEASLAAVGATVPDDPCIDYGAEVRAWLIERIRIIGQHDEARATLSRHWPEGMPYLHRSTEHTPDDLLLIEHLLDDVEGRHSLPFGPSKPGSKGGLGRLLEMFPGSEVVAQ